MHIDLTTFLTTVYCITDELYQQHFAHLKPKRPGKKPDLSDSEVLSLTILAQWQQSRSERAFGEYAAEHWRSFFPRLLSQSQFNRRSRDLAGVLSALGPAIARELTRLLGVPAYEVLDGVPVPLMRRCRGDRHRCFRDEAALGCGGSDRDWYYGVKLLTAVNAHGLITGFVVGPANTEERWLGEALLRWRAFPLAEGPKASDLERVLPKPHDKRKGARKGPSGPVGLASGAGQATSELYIADLGYAGEAWEGHWRADYGARVLTQAAFDGLEGEAKLARQLHGLRQVVERVNQGLDGQLGLKFPRARTWWGLQTRLAAKVAAYNLSLVLNHLHTRPPFAHVTPFA
jgi:hypothetical protein